MKRLIAHIILGIGWMISKITLVIVYVLLVLANVSYMAWGIPVALYDWAKDYVKEEK